MDTVNTTGHIPGSGLGYEKAFLQKKAEDFVNHPSHYTAYEGLEIIDLTEQMNFNKGNAVKYIARAGLKDPDTEVQDLEKAEWYIRREIERLKKPRPGDPIPVRPATHEELVDHAKAQFALSDVSCPTCSFLLLLSNGRCPNGHGTLRRDSYGYHKWDPRPVDPIEKSETWPDCVTCKTPMRLDASKAKNRYYCKVCHPLKTGLCCPECDSQMTQVFPDDNHYHCPNGHGSMIFSKSARES